MFSDSVGTGSDCLSLTCCVHWCQVHKSCESAVLIFKIVVVEGQGERVMGSSSMGMGFQFCRMK